VLPGRRRCHGCGSAVAPEFPLRVKATEPWQRFCPRGAPSGACPPFPVRLGAVAFAHVVPSVTRVPPPLMPPLADAWDTDAARATRMHRVGVSRELTGRPSLDPRCRREEPSRPIIPAKAKRRKWHIPFQTRSRARDIKKNLAHVNVFGLNAPNEPVLARKSFVCGIARSAGLGLKVLA